MDDAELEMSLRSLGLDRENQRAVALLPLIEVAWADGRIQRAERQRIQRIAREYGLAPGDPWLERWLTQRPPAKTFFAARTVLLALMTREGEGAMRSVEQLLDQCLWVAEAAGGLFGLAFTVSRQEQECIDQIAASLALGPALPDGVVSAWHEARRKHFLAEAPTAHRRRVRYGILDQTTAHLDIWAHRTQSLADPPDPLISTEGEAAFDQRTVARVAVPVQPPDDTGALPLIGGMGVSHLIGESFASADDLPTSGVLPKLSALKRMVRSSEAELPPPPPRPAPPKPAPPPPPLPPATGGPRVAPEPNDTLDPNEIEPPSIDPIDPPHTRPPPVPLGPRTPVVRAGQTARTPSRGLGERFTEEDPTLPFFDDVNVGTYALDPEDR